MTSSSFDRRLFLLNGLAALGGGALAQGARPTVAPSPVPLALFEGASRDFVLPLLNLIAAAAGIRWSLQFVPYARMVLMVRHGQALGFGLHMDTATQAIGLEKQRSSGLSYSDAVCPAFTWLVALRSSAPAFERLADLQGRRVCVLHGGALASKAEAYREAGVHFERYNGNMEAGLAMLRAQRCHLLAVSSHQGPQHSAFESGLQDRHGADLLVLRQPLTSSSVHFSAAPGSPWAALLPRINQAIRLKRADIAAQLV